MVNSESSNVKIQTNAEKTLSIVAQIILYTGLLAAFICLCTIVWVDDPSYKYMTRSIFNPTGLVITIAVALSSVTSWAVLNVISNISIRLSLLLKESDVSKEEEITGNEYEVVNTSI